MNPENRYSAARDKFFKEDPSALALIKAVKPAVIEACGITAEEYNEQQRRDVFADVARSRGLEVDEFVILLTAESPEHAQQMRLDRHRRLASALGMDWEEYKQINRMG